jgi:hypothetical protein
MKRFINLIAILIVALLCIWDTVNAQLPIRLGFNAGINIANQSLTNFSFSDSKGSRKGVIIGGLVELGISNLFSIQAEPRYIQKGRNGGEFVITTADSPEGIGRGELVYKLDYIEIPLLLKARVGPGNIKGFFFAGPNLGLMLSAKGVLNLTEVYVQSVTPPPDVDLKDEYETLDLSIDAGGGVEYRIGPKMSFLGSARYSHGLSNISSFSPSFSIKSYGIQIMVGVLFDL